MNSSDTPTLRVDETPWIQPRQIECPDRDGPDEIHDMGRYTDPAILDGRAALVITIRCSCGWEDVLELTGDE